MSWTIKEENIILGGPQDHPQVQQFANKRIQRTQHIVLHLIMIYYSKNMPSTISKEKRNMEQSPGQIRSNIQLFSSSRIALDILNSPSSELWQHTWRKYSQPRDSVPKLLSGGWSSSTSIQIPHSQGKKKWILGKNHIISANNFGTKRDSY